MKPGTSGNVVLLPRMLRLRDAPAYLGMDRNRFNAEVRPASRRSPSGSRASRSTGSSSTPGWTTTSRSTGDGRARREQHHGKEEAARPRQARRHLAHRQAHRRSASLPEHWNRSARRSGAVPRATDGGIAAGVGLRRSPVADIRAGGREVRAREPAQAQPAQRHRAAEAADAVDRLGEPRQGSTRAPCSRGSITGGRKAPPSARSTTASRSCAAS